MKNPIGKSIFCSKFAFETSQCLSANAYTKQVKSLQLLLVSYLHHMLVKFEQNPMVELLFFFFIIHRSFRDWLKAGVIMYGPSEEMSGSLFNSVKKLETLLMCHQLFRPRKKCCVALSDRSISKNKIKKIRVRNAAIFFFFFFFFLSDWVFFHLFGEKRVKNKPKFCTFFRFFFFFFFFLI